MKLTILTTTVVLLFCSIPVSANVYSNSKKLGGSNLVAQTTDKTVYVLLYNAGTEREGIYTILYEKRNKVLMFERQENAQNYSKKLVRQDFPTPTAERMNLSQVQQVCKISNYDCSLVRAGNNLTPPADNGVWHGKDKIVCDENECRPAKNKN
jgi:hypothetical protein